MGSPTIARKLGKRDARGYPITGANVITEKRCTRCGATKPATSKHFHRSPANRCLCVNRCKICQSEVERARRGPKITTSELFWSRVDSSAGASGCWEWTGSRHYRGYGRFGRYRELHETFAHRFAWADKFGDIPEGIEVRHKCDNPPCCNPDHLELGTHQENMNDMVERKRLPVRRGEQGARVILKEHQVLEIRSRAHAREHRGVIAADYGVSTSTVGAIYWRRIWRHLSGGPMPVYR